MRDSADIPPPVSMATAPAVDLRPARSLRLAGHRERSSTWQHTALVFFAHGEKIRQRLPDQTRLSDRGGAERAIN